MSTTELTRLPESFAAGTTLTIRRSFSDHPASAGWTLTLYLAGASVAEVEAVADGDDFVLTIAADVTSAGFAAGFYKWEERVSLSGAVYRVDAGVVTVLPNLAEATDGTEQVWIERAIVALRSHIEGRLPAAMESYSIAGRAVSKMPVKEALDMLNVLESRLARLRNPTTLTRPVLVSFTGTGTNR